MNCCEMSLATGRGSIQKCQCQIDVILSNSKMIISTKWVCHPPKTEMSKKKRRMKRLETSKWMESSTKCDQLIFGMKKKSENCLSGKLMMIDNLKLQRPGESRKIYSPKVGCGKIDKMKCISSQFISMKLWKFAVRRSPFVFRFHFRRFLFDSSFKKHSCKWFDGNRWLVDFSQTNAKILLNSKAMHTRMWSTKIACYVLPSHHNDVSNVWM